MPMIPLNDLLEGNPEKEGAFFDQAAVLYAGSVIRRMREFRGYSQKEMAARVGTSQPHISDIERGAGLQGPTFLMLAKVARACDLSLSLLVGDGKVEMPPTPARSQMRHYATAG
jgi:transcriptional regulator with XRE-family HTH domain